MYNVGRQNERTRHSMRGGTLARYLVEGRTPETSRDGDRKGNGGYYLEIKAMCMGT